MDNTPAVDTLNLYDLAIDTPESWEVIIKDLFVSYSQLGSQVLGVDSRGDHYLAFLTYIQQGV
uniref:hypothetical protein n=1 Tax=Trichocoleus desertorum TaxID=1481672 RepID=UPI0025B4A188|nr:hypothetical protein [Trichocoleus desertorum]